MGNSDGESTPPEARAMNHPLIELGVLRFGYAEPATRNTPVRRDYIYQNDKISSITQNGFNYNLGYDSLGNNTTVSVGNQNLITNSFEARTGKLLNSAYGNGHQVSSDYDALDRVIGKKYNGTTRYTYEYDASGNLGYQNDIINGMSYRYIYDVANRPIQVKDSQGNSINYTYDLNNNRNKVSEKINGNTYDTNYGFDKDNKPKSITYNRATANSISLDYDTLGRNKSKTVNTGSATFNTVFGFLPGINGSTSKKVGSINNNGAVISYTYDANGNIETINQNSIPIKYYYNELNEVIREDNAVLNKTIVYTYDVGGNIINKIEYPYTTGTLGTSTKTYAYDYTDSNWKDKLTSFDGKAITYDTIGNPVSYNGWNYTWEEGRQLAGITGNGNNISYKYNDGGIRTSKTVNGVTTKYNIVGDKVTYETNGTDNVYYTNDASNDLVSMNLNGVEYYYIRNGQGDIIGLFDKTGTQVVNYTYDTWGKLISTTGSLASTVGVKNPYRYRGYRYDTETGIYYLNSRYYNPEWGRFINADGILGQTGELLGHNLFAYCKNNAVNKYDSNGFMALDMEGHGRTYTSYAPSNPSEEALSTSSSTKIPKDAVIRAVGASFSVGFGIRIGMNIQYVFDDKGHKAFALTPFWGGSTPDLSASITYSRYYHAKSLNNLSGWGGDAGGSAPIPLLGSGGGDYLFGAHNGVSGVSGNIGSKGYPTIHTDVGYTFLLH